MLVANFPVDGIFWRRFPDSLAVMWIAIYNPGISCPPVSNAAIYIALHKVFPENGHMEENGSWRLNKTFDQ